MSITYEKAINQLGDLRNPYQLFLCIYSTYYISNFEFMLMLFMALPANFRCNWNSTLLDMNINIDTIDFSYLSASSNHSIYDNQCELGIEKLNSTIKCKSFIFENTNSLVSEFNLVCEKSYIRNMLIGAYWIGFLLAVTNGLLSDIFGRRKIISIQSIVFGILLYIAVFSWNIWFTYILQICKGYLASTGYLTYNLTLELLNIKSRKIFGMNFFLINVTVSSMMAIVAFYMPYWRYLQLLSAIYMTPIILSVFIFPESPRWLLAKGRFEEAQTMVDWLCRKNKVKAFDVKTIILIDQKHYSIINQLNHKQAVYRIILISLFWSILPFIYYGLSYNLKFLNDNPYVSYSLNGFIEVPAIFFTFFLLRYFGYKFILYKSAFITGLAIIFVYVLKFQPVLRIVIGLIGKFFSSVGFIVGTVFTVETFPTSLRTTGFCLNYFARMSIVLIPYALDLKFYHPILPTLLFSSLSFLLVLLILPFPETCGKQMHQTVQDLEPISLRNICDKRIVNELAIEDSENRGDIEEYEKSLKSID